MVLHKFWQWCVICGILLISHSSHGTDRYVRAGAMGKNDGSNWADAWTDLPGKLVRGDTYYIADGTYKPYIFDDPESGSTYIAIKKATVSDHGTNEGWEPAYGDGVAEWTTGKPGVHLWLFRSGHYILDGQVGGGPGNWESGHGFKVSCTNTRKAGKLVAMLGGPDHIEFHHIDMEQSGISTGTCSDGMYVVDPANGGSDFVSVDHCYIHEVDRVHILMNHTNNWTIEYTKFKNRNTTGRCHGESISANFIGLANNVIRYSVFQDVAGTGYIVLKSDNQSNWDIYGNIFFETQDWAFTSNGTICDTSHPDSISDSRFHNNTFANLKGRTGIQIVHGTGNEAYNNIFFSCGGKSVINSSTVKHDYSWVYGSRISGERNVQNGFGNMFLDIKGGNFRPGKPTKPGISLGPPYDMDADSNQRGKNGIWTRGAFQYSEEVASPNDPPRD